MAECRIEEDEGERTTFGSKAKNKTRYGSTTATSTASPSPDRAELYIKHEVKEGESLASIALRYGLKSTHIQRINHLWNDCLLWHSFLYIPILSHDLIPEDYKGELLSKTDLFASRLQHSQSESQENGKDESEPVTESDSTAEYFAKFDSSLAQIKDSLEKIEKRSNLPQDDSNNPLHLISKKKKNSSRKSWSSGIESLDPSREPEMRFLSQSSSTKVRTSTLERLEKAQDELFQL